MTFTATQESNVGTRTAINRFNGVDVDWQTSDKISVFDGQGNRTFTLTEDVEDGKFSGTASSQATSFTAVYPYTEGAKLEKDGSVSGITLPAEQTPTICSFDPKAALMMAVSTKDKKYNLDFKNAVSLIKLQIEFPCKKIVLTANEDIAGTGTLTYNNGAPSISFTSNQSKTITLKPATGEYLKKGGRISSTVATLGGILSIKPVLTVNDGLIEVIGKAKGSRKANNLLNQFVEKFGGINFNYPIALAYSGFDRKVLDIYLNDSKDLYQEMDINDFDVYRLGAVIGSYAGPNGIVLAFFANNK